MGLWYAEGLKIVKKTSAQRVIIVIFRRAVVFLKNEGWIGIKNSLSREDRRREAKKILTLIDVSEKM